jgi:ABC-2 type transport system ATP-binding protein
VKKLGKNHTVILSSHILPEVQAVCDKIVIINKGKIVADGTAGTLSADLSSEHNLTLRVEGKPQEITKLLSGTAGVVKVYECGEAETGAHDYKVEAKAGADIRRDVFRKLANRNYPVLMMKSNELTLEEVFLRLTMGDTRGDISEIAEVREVAESEKSGGKVGKKSKKGGKQ